MGRIQRRVAYIIRPGLYEEAGAIKRVAVQHPYTAHFGHPAYCNRERFAAGQNIVAFLTGNNTGDVAGFACIRHKVRKPETEIDIIGVAEVLRSAGCGKAILDYIKSISPHQRLTLDVLEDNERARAFYSRYGFIEIGTKVLSKGTAIRMEYTWQK